MIGAIGCPGGSGEYLQMPGHLHEHLFKLEKLGVESNHIVYGMFPGSSLHNSVMGPGLI